MGFETVNFEFYVRASDIEGYKQREEFLTELKSIPELEVSAHCESAANTGLEQFVVNVIAALGGITTIADFFSKYFRNKKKKSRRSITIVVPGESEVILNDSSRDEIVRIISTRSSYAYNIKPPSRTTKKLVVQKKGSNTTSS